MAKKRKPLNERQKKWIERTVKRNRSYKALLYNRFFLYLILVLLQLAFSFFWVYMFVYNSKWGIIAQAVISVCAVITVLYLINKNDRPSVKLNWILLILVFPVFGVPAYLMYGEGRPTWSMNQKILQAKGDNA